MKHFLIDSETTGKEEKDRVLQAGGMLLDGDKVTCFDEICSCPVETELEAMEVHGITPEMQEGKVPCVETKFYKALLSNNNSKNFLFAHNADFDVQMFMKEGFIPEYIIIDTLRVARHLYKDSNSHRLQYLRYSLGLYKDEEAEAKKHGITITAHQAIGDVLVMKLLISKMVEKIRAEFPDVHPIQKMHQLTNTPVLMTHFRFGKHKGAEIASVAQTDRGYLTWMRDNMDLEEDMIYTLETYLV